MLIVLCGPPAAGKSDVGRKLAEMLNYSFVDTDEVAEKMSGMTRGQIFRKRGEKKFRELERKIIQSYLDDKRVMALGGGSPAADFGPIDKLIIYLKVSPELLWQRISKRRFLPAFLTGEDKRSEFMEIIAKRRPIYEKMADITLENHFLSPEEAAMALYNLKEIQNGCQ